MEQVTVCELKHDTSQVLTRVAGGESLEVTERGRPIARLVPVNAGLPFLDRLVAEERALPPTTSGPVPVPPALGDPEVAAERW